MGEKLTEEGLFSQADSLVATLKKKGDIDQESLSHLMNSFDRLYAARHQEFVEISMQYHELSAQHSKRDADFRRLLQKYERLRMAGEPSEQGAVAKLMSAITRFLPGK